MPSRRHHTTTRKPYQNYSHPTFNWLGLFRTLDNDGKLRKTAREHHIPESTLRTRYHNWINAGRPTTHDNTPYTGLGDARGRASRALSDEAEHVLADLANVRRNVVPTHDRHVQQMARDIHAQAHEQQLLDSNQTVATRSSGPPRSFRASIGWLRDFKHRNDFNITHHPIIRPNRQKDKSESTNLFYSFLMSTLPHYPANRVINMDETPLPFAPGKWNVWSKRGDPTTLCTGTHTRPCYTRAGCMCIWFLCIQHEHRVCELRWITEEWRDCRCFYYTLQQNVRNRNC